MSQEDIESYERFQNEVFKAIDRLYTLPNVRYSAEDSHDLIFAAAVDNAIEKAMNKELIFLELKVLKRRRRRWRHRFGWRRLAAELIKESTRA
tara:strand:+ start:244 stop:522 length:279 start_codon:yes stop_codon:yes gene_type:complete